MIVIAALTKKLIGAGTRFIFISTKITVEIVDRIIVIDHGKLVADGPRETVVEALQQGRIGRTQ